jgi:ATP-dependent DNA helicase RecQ
MTGKLDTAPTSGAATATAADAALRAEAEAVLRALVGRDDARLREDQWEAVRVLVAERRRALVVQRTGWGKSAVYFVATALLRARDAGPTLLVSPLLALMRNQVDAAARAGIRAHSISSANVEEWQQVEAALVTGEVDVLLVSPERLNNPDFRDRVLPPLAARVGLLVVDEAHCISDWGHDFRPDYRRIRDALAGLREGVPVLATTATANERVVDDVAEQLGTDTYVQRGPLDRDSLRLGVLDLPGNEHRLGWLAAHLDGLPGSGIVYALTVAAAEDLAGFLRSQGHRVLAYTGRTDPVERLEAEAALLAGEVKALVATSALGMGFDKPDLGFVVHVGSPASPIAYYQQVGRAGRAVEHADVLLLPGREDEDVWRYFATVGFPSEQHVESVLAALAGAGRPLSTVGLEARVELRRTRLELLLKVLDVDGAVRRVRGGWEATGRAWAYDADRYARVAATRRAEQQAMRDYVATAGCRMAFLRRQLDDPYAADCGRCDRCAGAFVPLDVPGDALAAARAMLGQVGVEVEPRLQWPSAMDALGVPVRGRLAPDDRPEPGRAVARLSDLGWGPRLRPLLSPSAADAEAPDRVLSGVVDVLRAWDWAQRPVAVASMPSRTRPRLIASVAAHIASLGRLPFLGELAYTGDGPRGSRGGNSAFRLAAVWDQVHVPSALREALEDLDGPVLLVDDLADSRWTLTVAARALRHAGASSVLPLVLALDA